MVWGNVQMPTMRQEQTISLKGIKGVFERKVRITMINADDFIAIEQYKKYGQIIPCGECNN